MTSLYAYNEPCCERFNSENFQTYFCAKFLATMSLRDSGYKYMFDSMRVTTLLAT